MTEDDRRPKTMVICGLASNDEAYAARAPDCAHGCRKDTYDRSGDRQADGLADQWNAYYADRDSNAAERVPFDELFLPAACHDGERS